MDKYLISVMDESGNVLTESAKLTTDGLAETVVAWMEELGHVRDGAVCHHLIITKSSHLTLDEFRATKKTADLSELTEVPGDKGWVYDEVAYINMDEAGEPYLVIGNQQWNGDLGYLERILYFEHYLPEICGVTG